MDSYLVKLKVGSGKPGAPTLWIDAVVNAASGAMNGHGEITQAIAPPNGNIEIDQLNGRVTSLPLPPHPQKVVTLAGQYYYTFPPPAIGTAIEKVEVHLLVDAEWNGQGSFIYGGRHVENVPVKNVSRGD